MLLRLLLGEQHERVSYKLSWMRAVVPPVEKHTAGQKDIEYCPAMFPRRSFASQALNQAVALYPSSSCEYVRFCASDTARY
jgi:hypothetical protein